MAVRYTNRETAVLLALCLVSVSSLFSAASSNALGYDGDRCQTPSGEAGTCRVIGKCPSLLALVTGRPTQENLSYLNNLRCGFQGNVPVVCCTDNTSGKPSNPPFTSPSGTRQPTRPASTGPSTPQRPVPTSPSSPQVDSTPPDVSRHPNLNLLPLDYCSPPGTDRIVGGKEADVFAYPWIARLGYLSKRTTWKPVAYHCGGSLINSRYVLTAAHCIITKSDLYLATVKLGEHTIDKEIDCRKNNGACIPPPIDVDVEKTDVHPQYDSRAVGSHHDIALARLARPVDFLTEAFVRPVCLPVSRENQLLPLKGPLVAAGWGLTEDNVGSKVLRDVLLPVMPNEQCKEVFKMPGLQKEIIPLQLCAGGVAGKDSCNGDSGGPLILEADIGDESKDVLFGIVSFGHNECGTEGVPGIYTRVPFYMKWILDTIRP